MNKIKVKITGTEGPVGKSQLAEFLTQAVLSFDPKVTELPRIVIQDGADKYEIEPEELGQEPHAALFARVEEAGRPNNISGDILDLIAKSWDGADAERGGFAEEMAMQYGFTHLDGDVKYYGVTAERLVDMMSVLGYRTGKERRIAQTAEAALKAHIAYTCDLELIIAALEHGQPQTPHYPEPRERHAKALAAARRMLAATLSPRPAGEITRPYGKCAITGPDVDVAFILKHLPDVDTAEVRVQVNPTVGKSEPAPQPASVKTEHDDLDKLLYAFGQAASAAKVGDNLYDLSEFKAIKAAFEKARFLRNWDKIRLNSEFGGVCGGLVGSGESYANVTVRNGYAGLHHILVEALNQAQRGKGAERHNLGGDIPFERQRMQQISELIGSVDGMTYQACKKITEGVKLPTLDRQVAELLGAINYIAGMITFLRGRVKKPVSITIKADTSELSATLEEIRKGLGLPPLSGGHLDVAAIAQTLRKPDPIGEAWINPVKDACSTSHEFRKHTTGRTPPKIGNATLVEVVWRQGPQTSSLGYWSGQGAQTMRADEVDWAHVYEWRVSPACVAAKAVERPAPDECPANGQSCVMQPDGPKGETQCAHCGSSAAKAAPHHPV